MKRYVKEFAIDCMREITINGLMLDHIKRDMTNKIADILHAYKRNLISNVEAVKAIADVMGA